MILFIVSAIAIFISYGIYGVQAQTPVASQVIALPSLYTYFKPTSPVYKESPFENSLTVSSAVDWNLLKDFNNDYSVYRDGGGSCALSNRSFFFFDDTTIYDSSGTFKGFATNSVSQARSYAHPGWLYDLTSSISTGIFPAIPFTTAEAVASETVSQRYALWTYTNCVAYSSTEAVHFWTVHKYTSSSSSSVVGTTMAKYSLDNVANTLTVTRDSQFIYGTKEYAYGSFANLVVNGAVYLYALDSTYSSGMDIHLAIAPAASVTNQSTWLYYNASTKTTSTTKPVPTGRDQAGAVISNSMPFSSGNIFFSAYHNSYLLVFFNNWIDSTFRILYSSTPVGPWSTSNKAILQVPIGKSYSYGAIVSPQNYQNNGQLAGQTLMLGYSYQSANATYPRAYVVSFD
ncbi:hypothetical protein V1511DRAFT_519053 [Dipodascopsis uninucleata]